MDGNIIPEPEYGPAMRRLTEMQRRYVIEYINRPSATGGLLAKLAGYSGSAGNLRAVAYQLRRNPMIERAIREETHRQIAHAGNVGLAGLMRLALNDKHPRHAWACAQLADRAGWSPIARQEIKVEHADTGGATMVGRIRELAGILGIDAEKLLGKNDPKLIEGRAVASDG